MSIQLDLPFPPEIEWRVVPGRERYEVSNTGLIRNKKTGKLISTKPMSIGYTRINTVNGRKQSSVYIHRLVMLAFVGECPSGMEVNHKNGIRSDNRLENLEYVTHQQNVKHSYDVLGRVVSGASYGVNHPFAKLNDDKVREIRRLHSEGYAIKKLARMYGLTPMPIRLVIRRKAWKHVE